MFVRFLICLTFFSGILNAQSILIDKIIAKVDNQILLQSELELATKQFLAETRYKESNVQCQVLETLIINKLLLAKADIDSVVVDDKTVDEQLDRRMEYFVSSIGSEKKLEEYYNKTIGELKSDLRRQVKEQLIVQKMQDQITKKLKVTPGEVKKFFNNIPEDSLPFYSKEVEVGQIVKIPSVNRKQLLEAKSKLQGLRDRIMNGESFETLARENSDEPAARNTGGNLGFQKSEDLDQTFVGAALKLKPGEISGIVETQFGLHIIQMIERRGSEFNARHILIKPASSKLDLEEASKFLDSLRTRIKLDSISFELAAKKYSDDKYSSSSGGMFVNQQDNSSRIAVESLDPVVFFIIDTMEVNQISSPIAFRMPDGKDASRLIWYKSRVDAHKASYKQDYQKIYSATLEEKKAKAVNDWFEKAKHEVFIEIKPEYSTCKVLVD
ncbi:MAG: peptidylprolyl isomerase [Opitutaceae bacterium]|nr:peptidylprolyl isomerase [Cytophagales bacterium]